MLFMPQLTYAIPKDIASKSRAGVAGNFAADA
jgi:hypothetical protein